ncbi:exonuclease domain-containing protein [Flavobacterium sp.]
MKKTEYAIVDIETTGGNARGSRITEIAIFIHDGKEVIERWESLVNPQQEIPLHIFSLTGINNHMVRNAPIFDDLAEKVLNMLTDRIFVAHNVNFDYSFVHHELERSGFKWSSAKLCTVRAARKIKPGLKSYSLGVLCNSLGISLENRHRAGGDTEATAILFSRLLQWDTENVIAKMIKKNAPDQRLPPNVPPRDFDQLPQQPGVYYFYSEDKKVIYVGKAINLKKRVASHFSGNNSSDQRQNFLRDIYSISFEICATELMALLLECNEIKTLWPQYNRALKKFEPKFGLYDYEAINGYRYLAITKITKFQKPLEVFNSMNEGITALRNLAEQFKIDYRFCKYNSPNHGELFQLLEDFPLPESAEHNLKIEESLNFLLTSRPTFAVIDKGRNGDEYSCIWIENGHFYGMGYISNDITINFPSELKEYLTPYRSNHYLMQLINTYALRNPRKIKFQSTYTAVQ